MRCRSCGCAPRAWGVCGAGAPGAAPLTGDLRLDMLKRIVRPPTPPSPGGWGNTTRAPDTGATRVVHAPNIGHKRILNKAVLVPLMFTDHTRDTHAACASGDTRLLLGGTCTAPARHLRTRKRRPAPPPPPRCPARARGPHPRPRAKVLAAQRTCSAFHCVMMRGEGHGCGCG